MPSLRQCLTNPATYLALLAVVGLAAVADSFRSPERQATARIYAHAVAGYRAWLSPTVSQCARCRFKPTCSVYSAQAVREHGVGHGFVMTAGRLWRCNSSTAFGTYDPVAPVRDGRH